jgi:antirestriction protein ArdC
LPLLSPKQASVPEQQTKLPKLSISLRSGSFEKPVFPFHLHRSPGPGKQLPLLRNPKERDRDMSEFRDAYSKITNRIIADLEQGVRPWMRPWSVDHAAGRITRPLRHNGIPYKGINVVMLWSASVLKGYACPLWLTFRQAQELGGNIRKCETGELVVYANRTTRTETDAKGEEIEREIPFLKGYTVFNAEQCDGLPAQYSSAGRAG